MVGKVARVLAVGAFAGGIIWGVVHVHAHYKGTVPSGICVYSAGGRDCVPLEEWRASLKQKADEYRLSEPQR